MSLEPVLHTDPHTRHLFQKYFGSRLLARGSHCLRLLFRAGRLLRQWRHLPLNSMQSRQMIEHGKVSCYPNGVPCRRKLRPRSKEHSAGQRDLLSQPSRETRTDGTNLCAPDGQPLVMMSQRIGQERSSTRLLAQNSQQLQGNGMFLRQTHLEPVRPIVPSGSESTAPMVPRTYFKPASNVTRSRCSESPRQRYRRGGNGIPNMKSR